MKPKLLRSVVVLTAFWFCFSALIWSLAQPEVQHNSLKGLAELLPFLPLDVPEKAYLLDTLSTQGKVLTYWTIPVLVASLLSALTGFGALWLTANRTNQERTIREAGKGEFRSVTITLGDLPVPRSLPADVLDLSDDDSEEWARITERERQLLGQILGTISAAGDPHAGDGVTGSLLDHALDLANAAVQSRNMPGLSMLAAVASELGKLTAYSKTATGWELSKPLDRESARILSTLPAWWELPYNDRMGLAMAVKYRSTPWMIPDVGGDHKILRISWDLLNTAKRESAKVIEEKQAKALEAHEVPDILMNAFIASLEKMPFQVRGLSKGTKCVAWKAGARIFMLEKELNELVMLKLPEEVRAALAPAPGYRPGNDRVLPFTAHLLKVLHERGWLVTEIGEAKLDVSEALWIVKAGRIELRRVLILDVPVAYLSKLPEEDSHFELSVMGPLFAQPGASRVTKSALEGLLGPGKPEVVKPEAKVEPAAEPKAAD